MCDRLLHENSLTRSHGNAAWRVSNLSLHRFEKHAPTVVVAFVFQHGWLPPISVQR
ncbi:hypothetical protein ACFPFV_04345 [Salinicoccus siamensis]|uniref:hypothetical protein n=1 Tax=Salinicoccus siamensis TaxID=381830 RepID=UPI003623B46D